MSDLLPLRLALRYTFGHRRARFASFVSWMAVAGLVLGVALLVAVTAVMNGFDRELRERILGLVPHIRVYSETPLVDAEWESVAERFGAHPDVVATRPFAQAYAMIRFRGNTRPLLLAGIDPDAELDSPGLGDLIGTASLQALYGGGILLGGALAGDLGLHIGDRITLLVPRPDGAAPELLALDVVALLSTGTELDERLGFYALGEVGLPAQLAGAQGLRIYVDDVFAAYRIAREAMPGMPPTLRALTWESSHGNLYEAIQLSRQMVGLMVLLILAIAAFNVIASLLIVSADKRAEIAILKTLGASRTTLATCFALQGLLIGLLGTTAGLGLGLLLAGNVTDIAHAIESVFGLQLLNLEIYPIDYVPSDLRVVQIAQIVATSLILCVLAALYPAWRAASMHPAEVLREE